MRTSDQLKITEKVWRAQESTAQPDSRAQNRQDAASALSGVGLDVAAQESHCEKKNGGKKC